MKNIKIKNAQRRLKQGRIKYIKFKELVARYKMEMMEASPTATEAPQE